MSSNKLQTLKGFRDFLPRKMILRNEVMLRLREVFLRFGFEELQTPSLEYQEVLLGKYGEEAEKLMYLFEDQGGRKVGMRYDLTVPLARVASSYPDLPKPFKRFQIQPAWRAENTQKGRYREFYQCDVDIVGSHSPLADGEVIAVISESLKALGFSNYKIKVNSRSVLFSCMEEAYVEKSRWNSAIQSIDKLDKKTKDEVEFELSEKGFSSAQISSLFSAIDSASPDDFLSKSIQYAEDLGAENIRFEPFLARGLDYYTGPIFESVVEEPKIGSITGGGRYDKLLSTLGGPDLPATGTTIGLDRVVDVIEELDLWKELPLTTTRVYVGVFSPETLSESISTTKALRDSGVETEICLTPDVKIDKQLKYAAKRGIRWTVLIGPEEAKNKTVTLKDMHSGEQKEIPLAEAISIIKA